MTFNLGKKRLLSILTVIALALSASTAALSAWDGYPLEQAQGDDAPILSMDNLGEIFETGLTPITTIKGEGKYVGGWYDMVGTTSINIDKIPGDWSERSTLVFRIYSEKATQQQIIFLVYTELAPIQGITMSYYMKKITVDWTGWKDFSYSIPDGMDAINRPDPTKVTVVRFKSSGWSIEPDENTHLYFDRVYLKAGAAADGEDSGGKATPPIRRTTSKP